MNARFLADPLPPVDHRPDHWESLYPERDLPAGAQVTRFAPSPTGFVHIGGVYVALISKSVAHATGGSYFVRIEDTDQLRAVGEADEQFARAFSYFGVESDESLVQVPWGPYRQSQRVDIYLTYVRELLESGLAYPCFCTREELATAAERQRAAKVPTGYYGEWATCRTLTEADVAARLAQGLPSVIRFRSPGLNGVRATYDDAIRGTIEQDDNRNDIVLLKTGEPGRRLPTYHLAHVVDDHLMRVNLVIRGDEWISSVPLHLQLFSALGFEAPTYAHIAPLMKKDGSSKRKLSKRKDPEAAVDFYIAEGYPAIAVLHYLRGLANARLADRPIDEVATESIRLTECSVAGPLVDLGKLTDISSNFIADLPGTTVLDEVASWAQRNDPDLLPVLQESRDLALRALDVERGDVENKRKDLAKWSDFRPVYGFFFPQVFELVTDPGDERFGTVPPPVVVDLASDFVDGYRSDTDQPRWFQQIRDLADSQGFAPNAKAYKADPERYVGMLRDAASVIRVLLTGSTRSPDLHAVASVLGEDEVKRRVGAVREQA